MKTFFKALFSLIFTTLLVCGVFTFALAKSAQSTLTEENLSAVIKESIEDIGEAIVNGDESAAEISAAITDVMKQAGLNEEQTAVLFENEDLKGITSDFISSAILHQIDGSTEVAIPSEDELTDVVFNNIDTVAPLFGIENTGNITKEDVQQSIHENYDTVVNELNKFVESLGGAAEWTN